MVPTPLDRRHRAASYPGREQIDEAFEVWDRRSRRVWELELSILTGVGITVRRPERAADRPTADARALHREQTRRPDPYP
jgi:hypothetical protein